MEGAPNVECQRREKPFDLVLDSGMSTRLTDPRRFGAVLWEAQDPLAHPLLADLARRVAVAETLPAWLGTA
jgi:formamidopyrimidine-DNA glycosylase